MMCQSCGKKTATTHIKTIVNGKLAEYHLCADCAKQKGYSNIFSNWGMDFGNLLGGFMGSEVPLSLIHISMWPRRRASPCSCAARICTLPSCCAGTSPSSDKACCWPGEIWKACAPARE